MTIFLKELSIEFLDQFLEDCFSCFWVNFLKNSLWSFQRNFCMNGNHMETFLKSFIEMFGVILTKNCGRDTKANYKKNIIGILEKTIGDSWRHFWRSTSFWYRTGEILEIIPEQILQAVPEEILGQDCGGMFLQILVKFLNFG